MEQDTSGPEHTWTDTQRHAMRQMRRGQRDDVFIYCVKDCASPQQTQICEEKTELFHSVCTKATCERRGSTRLYF